MLAIPLVALSLFVAPLPVTELLNTSATSAAVQSGPHGLVQRHGAPHRGWMAPDSKTPLLYVAEANHNLVDVYSVPSYALIGQIAEGVDQPEGLATDKKGRLYVANYAAQTVTVYSKGATSPSLTLTVPYAAVSVAVTKDGYVVVGDYHGGVNVYAPGATTASYRLTNPQLGSASGIALDKQDNVYVAWDDIVVEFADLSGSGTNLQLTDLADASGVIVDQHRNIVVTDFRLPGVNIYPPGSANPSATIGGEGQPDRSALNAEEDLIYVTNEDQVDIYTYPSGTLVESLTVPETFLSGITLSPGPKP
jgi:hypothetical protein